MPNSARRLGTAASGLLGLIAAAIIAGVLVAVAVTPAVAVTGVAAKQGIGLFEDLPSDLKIVALDQKTEIYAKSGGKDVLLTSFYAQDRDVIDWSDVPTTVKQATLAGEDVRFYEHGGVDPTGIVRAAVSNVLGDDIQGASTITQQYVKNVCVQEAERNTSQQAVTAAYDECTDTSLGRKLREMRLAIGLEKKYSKNDILLGYLNIAGFGGRVYGIEAASEYYFGVSAKDLSIGQAAALMAIVNNPENFRLDEAKNVAGDTVRRDHILDVELQQHWITQQQHDEAVASPVKVDITEPKVGCEAAGIAGYFCDAVVNTIENSSLYGSSRDARESNLESGGWRIYTTLDLDLQKKAQATMATYVPASVSGWKVAGTGTSLQVGNGRVLTMVQNTHYSDVSKPGNTVVNYNTDSATGGSGGFQPGSTFKLFTLLDWLKTGHTLNDTVDGSERSIPDSDFTACGKPFQSTDTWSVGNDEGESGSFSILQGTARSINGVFASMAQQLDLCDIRDLAESMGVRTADGSQLDDVPPFVIGSDYVTPLAMAAAYSTIANNGVYCTPVLIDSIVKPDGSKLPVPQTSCKQVLDKQVAIAAAYALRGVITGGTAYGDQTSDGLYEFGKTGTTDGNAGTWMIGSTSKVTTAVMVANNGTQQDLRAVYDFPFCPVDNSPQAAIERHCLWHAMQTAANATYGGDTSWPDPESQYLYGGSAYQDPGAAQTTSGTVPNVVGQSEQQAEQTLVANGFAWAIGSPEPSDQSAGSVASTEPAAGGAAAPHTEVVIHPSSG